jgi:hypothetical protein
MTAVWSNSGGFQLPDLAQLSTTKGQIRLSWPQLVAWAPADGATMAASASDTAAAAGGTG